MHYCTVTIGLTWPGSSAVVHAGERLCSTEDCIPSTGTYPRHGYIFASLAGYVLRKNEGEEVSSCISHFNNHALGNPIVK